MHIVILILLILAAFAFLLDVVGVPTRINLVAFGLLFWVLAVIIPIAQQ